MDVKYLDSVQECCNVLGPLFLQDPAQQSLQPLLAVLAGMDQAQLAAEWPLHVQGEGCGQESAPAEAPGAALEHAARCLVAGAQAATHDPHAASRSFHHLFVGPKHLEAPPWGSVYLDHEKVKWGPTCLDLGLWMRQQGVLQLADQTEPPDHFGRMLVLLAWLAQNKPELVQEYLAEHLLPWAHHYLQRLVPVAQAEGHALYVGAALLAEHAVLALEDSLTVPVARRRFFM